MHSKLCTQGRHALVALLCLNNVALAMLEYRAAPKGLHLRRRDSSMEPRHETHSLLYAHYASSTDEVPQSAIKISFQPKLPTIILEDPIGYDTHVYCETSYIKLQFSTQEVQASTRHAWDNHDEFILVTSASGCAEDGEHAAYIVKVSHFQLDSHLVTLEATSTTIKNCTERIDFDMGDHIIPLVLPKLKRRYAFPQEASTTTAAVSNTLPTPATIVTAPSSESDIGFSRKDLKLFPPDSSVVDLVPQLEALKGLTITCKDCTMAGRLKLEVAGFSMNTSRLDAAMDFLDEGFFQFTAKSMKATMAFEFDFAEGFALPGSGFVPQLPAINLIGLSVRGVFTFGPELKLTFPIEVALDSAVKYSTGFTFNVPDNSKIILNITNPRSSYSTGFQDTKLDALPWNLDAPDISLNFTAGFRPILDLVAGVGIADGPVSASGSAGFFLDLPSYTATVTAVHNKTDNCKDASPSKESNTRFRIQPFQFFRAGTIYDLGLSLFGQELGIHDRTDLAELRRNLPEQCLLFNSKTNSVDQGSANNNGNGKPNSAANSRPSTFAVVLVFIAACFTLL